MGVGTRGQEAVCDRDRDAREAAHLGEEFERCVEIRKEPRLGGRRRGQTRPRGELRRRRG